MSGNEHEGGGHHEHPWWETMLHMGGLGHGASEFQAVHHLTEGFHTVRGGALGMQAMEAAHLEHGLHGAGVSNWLAPLALASGVNSLINGPNVTDKIQGGLETVSGGVGTMGLAGAGLTSAGATGAGTALTGAAAAAAPVAAVAGAGAAGMALGNAGNNFMSRHGWIGQNEDGSNRNWSDMAADWGTSAREWAGGDGFWANAAGIGATLGGSIIGAGGAALSGIASIGESIGSGIASIFSW